MMKRHGREDFLVTNEGVLSETADGQSVARVPNPIELTRKFLFSRVGPIGERHDREFLEKLAVIMTSPSGPPKDSSTPAGFTYLGQFVDHDLTFDDTAVALGTDVTVEELVQGRTPALDLDSLYGIKGPRGDTNGRFDGARLRLGSTVGSDFPAGDPVAGHPREGHDLPRVGSGSNKGARRMANIPDTRNDENLIVAQVHLAFMRFHNAIVDDFERRGVTGNVFERAREEVVKHYQWMLREDFLPRICDPEVVADVFTKGRQRVAPGEHDSRATMPLEFSVGAYRLGHSMVRGRYDWNRVFPNATLELLFQFSGKSGTLSPDGDLRNQATTGSFEKLPTNWIADWRRMFDFPNDAGPAGASLAAPNGVNKAERIDTIITLDLGSLPFGAVNATPATPKIALNLAFRNLLRGRMVALASGQQMAQLYRIATLSPEQILDGNGGAGSSTLSAEEKASLVANTPLWFYVLREAEVLADGEHLGPLGSRIVAETFHRSIEASRHSIVRDPTWRPTRGEKGSFKMVHLLLQAARGNPAEINPLG